MRTTYIVYPVGADDVEKEKYANNGLDPEVFLARRIAEQLSGATVCNDEKRHKHEILIGKTNRPETADFLSKLKYNDYGYAQYGDKIVIAGHSDEATMSAIQEFIFSVINKKNGEEGVFYNNSYDFVKRLKYDIAVLDIAGIDISEYRIVYPKRNAK